MHQGVAKSPFGIWKANKPINFSGMLSPDIIPKGFMSNAAIKL